MSSIFDGTDSLARTPAIEPIRTVGDPSTATQWSDIRSKSHGGSGDGDLPSVASKRHFRPDVSAGVRHQTNLLCRECADSLEKAIKTHDDVLARSNAIRSATHFLKELWGIRTSREPQYATLVNMLQCVMASYEAECMTPEFIGLVAIAVKTIEAEFEINEEIVKQLSMKFIRNGIDIFRAVR